MWSLGIYSFSSQHFITQELFPRRFIFRRVRWHERRMQFGTKALPTLSRSPSAKAGSKLRAAHPSRLESRLPRLGSVCLESTSRLIRRDSRKSPWAKTFPPLCRSLKMLTTAQRCRFGFLRNSSQRKSRTSASSIKNRGYDYIGGSLIKALFV